MAAVSAGRAGRPGRRYRSVPALARPVAARWRAALILLETISATGSVVRQSDPSSSVTESGKGRHLRTLRVRR